MLTKSELKKKFIVKKSSELFIQKGFQSVTMSDIVEACKISRGGLYRYFKNTAEIFWEVLNINHEASNFSLKQAIQDEQPAPVILDNFFREQKLELLHPESTLTIAIYEFFFLHRNNMKTNVLQQQFEQAEEGLTKLIQYGIDRAEFNPIGPRVIAQNLIMLLEGIRVSGQVMSVKEELLDEQFQFIKMVLMTEKV